MSMSLPVCMRVSYGNGQNLRWKSSKFVNFTHTRGANDISTMSHCGKNQLSQTYSVHRHTPGKFNLKIHFIPAITSLYKIIIMYIVTSWWFDVLKICWVLTTKIKIYNAIYIDESFLHAIFWEK